MISPFKDVVNLEKTPRLGGSWGDISMVGGERLGEPFGSPCLSSSL